MFSKGERVLDEEYGYGTVVTDQTDMLVEICFDDDLAPSRRLVWWTVEEVKCLS